MPLIQLSLVPVFDLVGDDPMAHVVAFHKRNDAIARKYAGRKSKPVPVKGMGRRLRRKAINVADSTPF